MSKTVIVVTPDKSGKVQSSLISSDEFTEKNDLHQVEINDRIQDIIKFCSGIEDVEMKGCTKCNKEGRLHFHPNNSFSMLNTGKYHSQCKRCRTDQANNWCKKKNTHRRDYHRKYRLEHKPSPNPKKYQRKELQNLLVAIK